MKKNSIILLILMFLSFFAYETFKQTSYNVLEINSPTVIVLDINGNGVKDDDETFSVSGIESFKTKPDEKQSKLAKRLKISEEDALGLGFLAENFAKTNLLEQKVSLKNVITFPNAFFDVALNLVQGRISGRPCGRECDSDIYVDNKDYKSLLLNSGFAVEASGEITPQLKKNIEKVRKLNLRIFNNKSHKYHKLSCKYGLMAHNSQILPILQLPKDAKPCKFCLSKHQKNKRYKKYGKYSESRIVEDIIPNIPQAPTVFQTNLTKIFLTDLTRVLKPSNDCNTQVCQALLRQVNAAQTSIDFAIYGYTKIPMLQQALENAQRRGVKVRFVYDIDGKNKNLYPDTFYLTNILKENQADFGHGAKSPQSAIMHNKFFIFDHQSVLTGSANISNTDMSGFNSNAVILINSPTIAYIYSQEFEQMYSGRFHKKKAKIADKENILLDNGDFSIYFSPTDKTITTEIIPLVDSAQKYIYMPVFLITHKPLVDSLIRASHRGVAVKIIIDATNAHGNSSKHKILRDNGVLVKTENFAGKLHSKSIIIDDIYTVIGSMNFSKSGENINDENLIIIKNREIALFYKTFFQYLWKRIPEKWLKYNARSESFDSVGSCSDGIDNDFDGKIDKLDDSCKSLIRR